MMFRTLLIALVAATAFAVPALAAKAKPAPAAAPAAAAQPTPIGQFGDWQAFQLGSAKTRSCFAITNPKERKPAALKRDPATFFVTRKGGDHNELSFIAGFPMKEGEDAKFTIGKATFALYTKEANAWVKNAAEEGTVVATMKKNKSALFEGSSRRGNKTSDRYSLAGFPQALEAISKACP